MDILSRSFGYLIPLFLVTVPVVVLLVASGVWIAARFRPKPGMIARIVLNSALILWLIGTLLITLTPSPIPAAYQGSRLELVPLRGIIDTMTNSASVGVPLEQLGGNIVLFAPLGALLRIRTGASFRSIVSAGALLAIAIEVTQYIMYAGRVASIDDVILGVLGTVLGVLAVSALQQLRKPHAPAGNA